MAENSAEKQAKRRGPGKPFQAGQSGNPSGKPKGTLAKTTQIAKALMSEEITEIVTQVVTQAKAGDLQAAKLILDRLYPPPKDSPAQPLDLGDVELSTISGLAEASGAVARAVTNGMISPLTGKAICDVLEAHRQNIESSSFEKRLTEMEQKLGVEKS